MKIYRYHEFISEGIFSGLLKSLSGKKSAIDSILSKISTAKMELVKESDRIKREIMNLINSKGDVAFETESLRKELESYQLSKNQEIENLKKEALKVVNKKSDLLSHYRSGISRIELNSAEEALKLAKKYDSEDNLKKLSDDLERLSSAVDKKSPGVTPKEKFQDNDNLFDPEAEKISSMSSGEFASFIEDMSTSDLDNTEKMLKKYRWSIQKLMDDSTLELRKKMERARKDDDVYMEAFLRKEIRDIESTYREEYKEVKDKIYKIQKISKKKYDTQKNK